MKGAYLNGVDCEGNKLKGGSVVEVDSNHEGLTGKTGIPALEVDWGDTAS